MARHGDGERAMQSGDEDEAQAARSLSDFYEDDAQQHGAQTAQQHGAQQQGARAEAAHSFRGGQDQQGEGGKGEGGKLRARLRAMSSDDEDVLPGSRPSQVLQWMSTVDNTEGAHRAVPRHKATGSGATGHGKQQAKTQSQKHRGRFSFVGSSGEKKRSAKASKSSGKKRGDEKQQQQQQQQQDRHQQEQRNPSSMMLEPSSGSLGSEGTLGSEDEDSREIGDEVRKDATENLNEDEEPMASIPVGGNPDEREHDPEGTKQQQQRREEHEKAQEEWDEEHGSQNGNRSQDHGGQEYVSKSYSTSHLDERAGQPRRESDVSLGMEDDAPGYSKSDVISPGMANGSEDCLQGVALPQYEYTIDIDDDKSLVSKASETSSQREEFTKEVRDRFDGVAGRVIFPNSNWVLAWDILILFLILFCSIYVPFQIGISDGQLVYQRGWAFLVFTFINIIFIIDVVLNFYRVYFDRQGRPVINRARIQLHYLRGWFFIDVVACLPVDIVYRFVDTNIGGGINVMAFVNMLRVFRLNRAYRIVRTNSRLLHLRMKWQQPLMHLAFTMGVFLLFAHWGGCMYSFVALVEAGSFREVDLLDDNKPNWLQSYVNNDGMVGVVGNSFDAAMGRYTLSLYWAITTISSVGYGDLTPHTTAEHWFTTIFMLLAGLMWAYFLGVVINTLEEMQEHTKEFQARIGDINRLSRYFQDVQEDEEPLPFEDPHLASNARSFLHKQMIASSGKSDGTRLTEMASVLSNLPPRLRNRICLALVRKDLLAVSYFRHFAIDLHTIGGVASLCEIHQYDTGEIMYIERYSDASKRGVFIVREGVLAVCEANSIRTRSMRILAGGGTIMEDYVLFPKDAPEIPPIVTIAFWTFAEVLFVPRRAIRALFRLHPEVWHTIGRWRVINIRLARWARSILVSQQQSHQESLEANGHRIVNTYSSDDFRRQLDNDSDHILNVKLGRESDEPQQSG